MKFKFLNASLVCLTVFLSSIANAGLIILHDESISGDLSDDFASAQNYGLLGPGSYDIIGSVDGDNGDEFDYIRFSTSSDWTVDLISIVLNGTQSLLTFQRDGVGSYINHTFSSTASNDILGTNASGVYSLQFIPGSNTGVVEYTARINIASQVPEPSTLAIFALGLIGLASRRLKKQ